MAVEIKRSNPKSFDVLLSKIKNLDGKQLQVGWIKSQYEDGTFIAYVAAIQEFGCAGKSIPPRPFMRPAISANQSDWAKLAGLLAGDILKGKETVVSAYERLGFKVETDIVEAIFAVQSPALSPITLELRAMRNRGEIITGKSVGEAARKIAQPGYVTPSVNAKPLMDTEVMLNAIKYIVEDAP